MRSKIFLRFIKNIYTNIYLAYGKVIERVKNMYDTRSYELVRFNMYSASDSTVFKGFSGLSISSNS